jgi:hypothetical protein
LIKFRVVRGCVCIVWLQPDNLAGTEELPDDGTQMPKHVGATD